MRKKQTVTSQTAWFDDQLLERFMHGFYGYGNLQAPYWFIGMEEGGGDGFAEITTRLQVWQRRGARLTEDVAQYHHDIGIDFLFTGKVRLQPTWAKLIRVLLHLQGREPDTPLIRHTQATAFAGPASDSCLLELLPLPSPSTRTWLYRDHSRLPNLKDRDTYRDHIAPQRAARIRELIVHHRPKSVLFYGFSYQLWWDTITRADFRSQSFGKFEVRFGWMDKTLFAVAMHPAYTGITNAYFDQLGKFMRQHLAQMRLKH